MYIIWVFGKVCKCGLELRDSSTSAAVAVERLYVPRGWALRNGKGRVIVVRNRHEGYDAVRDMETMAYIPSRATPPDWEGVASR